MKEQSFHLEFVLHIPCASISELKCSLAEFCEGLKVCESASPDKECRDFKINLETQEPTAVFDVCSQFGRIRSIKIDEKRG